MNNYPRIFNFIWWSESQWSGLAAPPIRSWYALSVQKNWSELWSKNSKKSSIILTNSSGLITRIRLVSEVAAQFWSPTMELADTNQLDNDGKKGSGCYHKSSSLRKDGGAFPLPRARPQQMKHLKGRGNEEARSRQKQSNKWKWLNCHICSFVNLSLLILVH